MRYLGIDFGTQKIGLALSDADGRFAFPNSIIPNDGNLLRKVVDIVIEESVDAIVIGESIALSGDKNPLQDTAEIFAKDLETRSEKEIFWEPEWFSSSEAVRTSKEFVNPGNENIRTRPVESSNIDAKSAAIILQRFLDRKNIN